MPNHRIGFSFTISNLSVCLTPKLAVAAVLDSTLNCIKITQIAPHGKPPDNDVSEFEESAVTKYLT